MKLKVWERVGLLMLYPMVAVVAQRSDLVNRATEEIMRRLDLLWWLWR